MTAAAQDSVPDLSAMTIVQIRAHVGSLEDAGSALIRALDADPRAGVRAVGQSLRSKRRELRAERARMARVTEMETGLRARGFAQIAGVDEAGRGPLAGPVIAAAVVLPADVVIKGLNDSKKIKPDQRDVLYDEITARALAWSIGRSEPREIDTLNILHASMAAMRRAILGLSVRPDRVLVDGNRAPESPYPELAVVEGDARAHCIAAASILAKVTRDREMAAWDRTFPGYGFGRHKGYGSPEHLGALSTLGPSPIHRLSFTPVRVTSDTRSPSDADTYLARIETAAHLDELDALLHRAKSELTGPMAAEKMALLGSKRRRVLTGVGRRGEEMAVRALVDGGFTILERNYRQRGGEIDIIAQKNQEVVFVEVKTSASQAFGGPEGWVPPAKQRRIARVAEKWITDNPLGGRSARFDVVAIDLVEGRLPTIRHFVSAFPVPA